MKIEKGEIYYVVIKNTSGSEVSGTRPAVIVSNNTNNEKSNTVTIVPLTASNPHKEYPFEAFLPAGEGGLPKDSRAKCNQIKTIDKSLLGDSIGKVGEDKMREIEIAIRFHLGMDTENDRLDHLQCPKIK